MFSLIGLKILLHTRQYENKFLKKSKKEKNFKNLYYFFASHKLVSGLQKYTYKLKNGFKKYPLLRW